ncbi:acyl-CoA mutase large subunit family protein [Neobacillus sp. DY30]|uniref:acyl-CoA mutase large subunit family protein n=1 Tax=Neobacillus sp. DY30 TaxID=3047871 RepID=UPI0024C01EA7|nr:acyl-CoA mutase large subunit family protein [Neobacillus sp. DY30]WHX98478.1 acyl-CoA mutase large subunit family protein [Neobacillus sp. DY30]
MSTNSKITESNIHLLEDFPTPAYQQWREVAEKTLNGANLDENLVSDTYEGIRLQPLYRLEDIKKYPFLSTLPGNFPYLRGTNEIGNQHEPWKVSQELTYSDPEEFNQAVRNDLEKGQTMLHLVLDEKRWIDPLDQEKVNSRGVIIASLQDIHKAFKDINTEEVPIYIEPGISGFPFFATFMAHIIQQNQSPKRVRGCIGIDPIGQLVQKGDLPFSINQAYNMMAEITKWSMKHSPELKTIVVKTHPYHNAGGNAVQELAFAIATGLEYLRTMENHQISIDDVAMRIGFSFSIGSNLFMEIAKFRAARMLWARIVKELGGNDTSQKMFIHARTCVWTKTIHDPYVNILRGTIEAFGGIIGGVNSLHVSPFDEAIGPPNEFSRRIARNTQLILENEANLSKVTDPAGGSWYIETLTYSLAEKAWELFQQIENLGGMYNSLIDGFPQETVAATAEDRMNKIKSRNEKIVGTNIFPNLDENPWGTDVNIEQVQTRGKNDELNNINHLNSNVESALLQDLLEKFTKNNSIENAIQAVKAGVTMDELLQAMCVTTNMNPSVRRFNFHRAAEPFESLREHAEKYKHKIGYLPKVFVAKIGPVSTYKHHADFVTEFLKVGGFQVSQHEEYQSNSEALHAFQSSKSNIVVILCKEEKFPEVVPSLAKRLKQCKSDVTILLAGYPPTDDRERYMKEGVDDFIHSKINFYEKLVTLQIKGGIRECTK